MLMPVSFTITKGQLGEGKNGRKERGREERGQVGWRAHCKDERSEAVETWTWGPAVLGAQTVSRMERGKACLGPSVCPWFPRHTNGVIARSQLCQTLLLSDFRYLDMQT